MIRALGVLMLLLAAVPGAAAADDGARAAVERLHGALAATRSDGCAGRLAALATVVPASFDTEAIARLVLRSHWDALSPAQRTAFTAALRDNIALNYARQFVIGAGDRFVIDGEQPQGRHLKVTARLQRSGQPAVSFDYLLQHGPDGWRIVNVFADGVSDAAVRRTQYDSLVRERGIDGPTGFVEAQNSDLRRACTA